MMMTSPLTQVKPIQILLVEDNPGDVLLTKEAFSKVKIANDIAVATDGEEALAYLRKEGVFADVTTPNIILLDLNLPKINGRELLEKIKDDPKLRRIPVVILTSSKAEHDIVQTYDLHASSYIVKPVDLNKFAQVVTAIENFWFTVVVLPTPDS